MGIISANLSFNRAGHELLDFSSLQNKYSDALLWAQDMTKNAAVGQYIYIAADETIDGVLYPKGPYVVDGIGENAAFTFLLGGNGSVTADTYAKVLDKATDDNVGQIIYLTADDTVADEATGEETVYYAGPYIVKGEGKVSKLTTTNAEDVSVTDQVEALDTRMDGLETNLNSKLDVSAHTAYTAATDATLAEKLDVSAHTAYTAATATALAGKVENTDYNQFVADTNAELLKKADDAATKSAIALKLDTATYNQGVVDLNNSIATKADDAEVKQLIGEKVAQADYNAYTATTNAAIAKKVEVETYEAFVSANTEALAEKLDVSAHTAYTAATDAAIASKVAQADYDAYVEANDIAVKAVKDTADEAKAWVDAFKDAENLGDAVVDTLKEIQNYINSDLEAADKMTKDIASKVAQADYDAYTAATDAALAKKVEVETYEAFVSANTEALAEKLDVSAHTAYTAATDAALAAKVESETYEAFVSANTEALAAKVESETYNAYTAATDAALAKKVESETYEAKIAEIEKSITDNKSAADEAIKDLQDNKADVNDVVLKEGYVAYSEEEKTKLAGIAENAQVNAIETITLFGNELEINDKTVAVDFQADDIKLGTAITTVENGESKDVFGADKTLSQTLQGIYDSLKSGLSGGVTSVTGADDSIVVSGDVNNREVKVQVSAAADNRLSIRTVDGEKGLYVEPLYYGGDDEEVE